MTTEFISLSVIVLVAAISPVIAQIVPGKIVPETVFLLLAGALLGPNLAGVIQVTEGVDFLSDLGLAFLFLLAGMEINPKSLTGREGRRGLATWLVTLVIAVVFVQVVPWFSLFSLNSLAVAIALTTTALGTLVPIMRERGIMGTPVGDSILSYGTWGELGPIVAIAILLSTRARLSTFVILLVFTAIAVLMAAIPTYARRAGSRLFAFITKKADSTYQTAVRMTVLVLVLLVTISALFDLDIVLGAFAAGFVIRYVVPEGSVASDHLETKLEGMAYGFFIPLFFVVSGAKVNLTAVAENPAMLLVFVIALLLVRGVPVYIALTVDRKCRLSTHKRWSVAFYCTTALPLIVAVTSIAVEAETMTQSTASVLVAAGAISVFIMPLLASITYRIADAKPTMAAKEIAHNPHEARAILRQHVLIERREILENKLEDLGNEPARTERDAKTQEREKERLEAALDMVEREFEHEELESAKTSDEESADGADSGEGSGEDGSKAS